MRKLMLVGAVAAASFLVAAPSFAQTVQYTGSLMIGFGDSDNPTDVSNNAVPICAFTGPNPFAPQTFGSLPVYGRAEQTASGALTFQGHGIGGGPQAGSDAGGAVVKVNATCNVVVPSFLNPRLRSRTQVGAAKWPGVRGAFPATGTGVGSPATPTVPPTYMLSAGNGNPSSFATAIPFFGGNGQVTVSPGANNYGGGIPYQGGGGVQLALNTTTMTGGGGTLMTFGVADYVNGFLPTDPQLFGTDAKGVFNGPLGATTSFPNGIIVGQAQNMALRTPGALTPTNGTMMVPVSLRTIDMQGAIQTLLGGDTGMGGTGPQLQSPAQFDGAFFEWTTGMVQHTDMVGDFVTERTATGFDLAVTPAGTPATDPNQTTRRLQLVSPWSASIALKGPFGFPVPDLGFGGLAVLTLDITPAPEPGTIAMLGFGVAGLAGLGAMRRRN
ncbi:MAG: PEP-CTERM sorting domain-containing protein [Myxococcota bacterium]